MPVISFEKYQGTGNDFIMIDDRENKFPEQDLSLISNLCNRKFGIGADGMILIRAHEQYDFEMVYFNPDGTQSLCGNGSRCAVMFSRSLGLISNSTNFLTVEGPLDATIRENRVHLRMPDVKGVAYMQDDLYLNTGSPHFVRFVPDADEVDVFNEGKRIRNLSDFPSGTNVNFVQKDGDRKIYVRTYERGVENETLSCGTGVTAAALAAGMKENLHHIHIRTRGGELEVNFKPDGLGNFSDIFLIGPAEKIFSGEISI